MVMAHQVNWQHLKVMSGAPSLAMVHVNRIKVAACCFNNELDTTKGTWTPLVHLLCVMRQHIIHGPLVWIVLYRWTPFPPDPHWPISYSVSPSSPTPSPPSRLSLPPGSRRPASAGPHAPMVNVTYIIHPGNQLEDYPANEDPLFLSHHY